MDQIAFFWVGQNIRIPTILVESIKVAYKSDVKIFHLTNMSTPAVSGVTEVFRSNLSNEIMLARLEAYKNFPYYKDLTCFCDADSLIINELNLNELTKDIYLIKRTKEFDGKLNANYLVGEYFTEFENKIASEVMPYFFGNLLVRNNKDFFDKLYSICLNLPYRFHKWYGDQYSLKLAIDKTNEKFELLDNKKYLQIVNEILSKDKIKNLIFNGTKLITFKGYQSKPFLIQSFLNILENN